MEFVALQAVAPRPACSGIVRPPLPRGRSTAGLAAALLLAASGLWTPVLAQDAVAPRPSFAQPAASPDGASIAFVSAGDIWMVDAAGGAARLLVGHPGDDGRPLFSPDGRYLAFESDREGGDRDLHLLELSTGEVRRLTWHDDDERLGGWSADGAYLYFDAPRRDPGGQAGVFRIPVAGGTPEPVTSDDYTAEYDPRPGPGGGRVAVVSGGRMARGQWWRNGSSHIDETGIWIVTPGAVGSGDGDGATGAGSAGFRSGAGASSVPGYRRVTRGGKNLWPLWSPDGDALVFMSDRSGTENLWTVTADGTGLAPLTDFESGRVLWPDLSADGSLLVFERDFQVWAMRNGSEPAPVRIQRAGATGEPRLRRISADDDFSALALSPDGQKVAFVSHGEIFAAGLEEGGQATRVTSAPAEDGRPAWGPDSRRVAYVSLRTGSPSIRLHDFVSGEDRALTATGDADDAPVFSPDGSRVAFVRNGREVRTVAVESGDQEVLARGLFWRFGFGPDVPMAWSPDGRWLAVLARDDRMFTNPLLIPVEDGGEPRFLTRLANNNAGGLAWSADGERFYLTTGQRTETPQLLEVDLVPRSPRFREDRFLDLFQDEETAGDDNAAPTGGGEVAGAPVRVAFDGVRQRLRPLPVGVSPSDFAVSPDGRVLVFVGSAEGRTNLYSLSVDPEGEGPGVPRQLTSTRAGKDLPQFTPDGKRVVYLDGDRIRVVTLASSDSEPVAVTAGFTVDVRELRMAAFRQGWRIQRDHFYRSDYHGADWEAVRDTFAPRIAGARSDGEMERLMNLMLGELNASHLGYRQPGEDGPRTADLGLVFGAVEGTAGGPAGLPVTRVVSLGPGALAGVRPGDRLMTVDGVTLDPDVNLNRLLEGRTGEKVLLGVMRDGTVLEVEVQPVSSGQVRQLAYRDWVEEKRAYVDRVSGGRLGYVHMPSMSWGSYQQLLVDLDAENHLRDGVVIDLRSNNGGFVNPYALDVFTRESYLTMEVRGFPETNARSRLGQRSLELPTALVVDRNTLSDGEDFTEGYRALRVGPVVGEPTAGWIIFTWGGQLVDGASFRVPRARIRGVMGDDMELEPRSVDLPVERPLGESTTDRDVQLDVAVGALLRRLEG